MCGASISIVCKEVFTLSFANHRVIETLVHACSIVASGSYVACYIEGNPGNSGLVDFNTVDFLGILLRHRTESVESIVVGNLCLVDALVFPNVVASSGLDQDRSLVVNVYQNAVRLHSFRFLFVAL